MTPLTIAFALSLAAQPTPSKGWTQTGRLIDQPSLHLGVRPAAVYDGTELDIAVTIQVSTNLL